MNRFEEKLKTAARGLHLTPHEKSAMRAALSRAMHRPVPSPYVRIAIFSRSIVAATLVVALIGTGTAYASTSALPGDPLYSVKVNVVEPVIGALQATPQAKATWQAQVAVTRLTEAATLAMQGRLTSPIAAQIQNNFTAHAAAAAQSAEQARSDNPQDDDALAVQIAAELGAHSAVLLALASSSPAAQASTTAALGESTLSYVHHIEQAIAVRENNQNENNSNETGTTPSHTTRSTWTQPIGEGTASTSTESTVSIANDSSSTPVVLGNAGRNALHDVAQNQITLAENELQNLPSGTATSTVVQLQAGIEAAKQALMFADGASDSREAASNYRRALQIAVSLKTYLNANQEFPQAHLLPALLKGRDNSDNVSQNN